MGLIQNNELGIPVLADDEDSVIVPENETNEPITHYLMNFMGQGPAVDPNRLAHEIGKALAACGVDLVMATTYISSLSVDPVEVGIKDTWMRVTDDDKQELRWRFSHLCLAIDLICGITKRPA